jgi:hypothetical protein
MGFLGFGKKPQQPAPAGGGIEAGGATAAPQTATPISNETPATAGGMLPQTPKDLEDPATWAAKSAERQGEISANNPNLTPTPAGLETPPVANVTPEANNYAQNSTPTVGSSSVSEASSVNAGTPEITNATPTPATPAETEAPQTPTSPAPAETPIPTFNNDALNAQPAVTPEDTASTPTPDLSSDTPPVSEVTTPEAISQPVQGLEPRIPSAPRPEVSSTPSTEDSSSQQIGVPDAEPTATTPAPTLDTAAENSETASANPVEASSAETPAEPAATVEPEIPTPSEPTPTVPVPDTISGTIDSNSVTPNETVNSVSDSASEVTQTPDLEPLDSAENSTPPTTIEPTETITATPTQATEDIQPKTNVLDRAEQVSANTETTDGSLPTDEVTTPEAETPVSAESTGLNPTATADVNAALANANADNLGATTSEAVTNPTQPETGTSTEPTNPIEGDTNGTDSGTGTPPAMPQAA